MATILAIVFGFPSLLCASFASASDFLFLSSCLFIYLKCLQGTLGCFIYELPVGSFHPERFFSGWTCPAAYRNSSVFFSRHYQKAYRHFLGGIQVGPPLFKYRNCLYFLNQSSIQKQPNLNIGIFLLWSTAWKSPPRPVWFFTTSLVLIGK